MLVLLKIIYFQALWYFCVILGSRSLHSIALLICVLSVLGDYFIFRYPNIKPSRYFYFVIGLACFGFGFDLIFTYPGLISWDSGLIYPASLLGIWTIFAAYYPAIFSKFNGRPILSFILGALFGPFAYWTGAQIGAIHYSPQQTTALIFHMIGWGIFFSLSIHLFQKMKREVPNGND